MFDKEALPMYKDKPFTYTPSYKNRPLWRKKRFFGSLVLGVVFLLYLLGGFSGSRDDAKPIKSSWSWMGLGDMGKADWEGRRSKVVEAFQLSWDTYERYAWGTSMEDQGLDDALISTQQATMSITQ